MSFVIEAPSGRTEEPANLEHVRSCLRSSSYKAIQHLDCHFNSGELVICGRVPSYYLKQIAQELVLRRCQNERVFNAVTVERSDTR
jgi:hypothetical protein